MATFQDLINDFQSILNRDDIGETQAATFIQQGIQRLQRKVRLPGMEREAVTTFVAAGNSVQIPSDMLSLIDLYVDDNVSKRALVKLPYRDLLKENTSALPAYYGRFRGEWIISGTVGVGSIITQHYHGEFSTLPTWADANEVTLGLQDLAVYAGLVYAAESVTHPSLQTWEARYQALLDDVLGLSVDLENTGGPSSIQPLYRE